MADPQLKFAENFATRGGLFSPEAVEEFMNANPTVFGSPPSVDITSRSLLTSGQRDALSQVLRETMRPGTTDISTIPKFGGDLDIDPSLLEGISLQGLEDRANLLAAGGAETINASRQALLEQLTQGPQQFEEFFDKTIREPLVKQFNEEIFPSLTASFSKNFFGSGQRQATARREEDLTEALATEFARLGFESRESNLERKLRASELVNQGAGSPTGELVNLFGAGQQATGLAERNIDRQFQNYLAQLQQRNEQVSQIISAIGIPALENIVINDPGSEGLLGGFLGGFGQGLGSGIGGFF